jgi:carbamate kinase
MRSVAALGGNAVLRGDESPDADIQESHVATPCSPVARLDTRAASAMAGTLR